jgi:DNA (cytosine-5)-methyltransferase 1
MVGRMLTFGSLFAGIGGFDLALTREGFKGRFAVELNPFGRAVLQHRFYPLIVYEDVQKVNWHELPPVDLLCGGFPCQDISVASHTRAGVADGVRSGLWRCFRDAIEAIRPTWVIIENSDQLVTRGLDIVLRDLAALGYDAEWGRIPAAAVGAPHLRWRLWVVAYPSEVGHRGTYGFGEGWRGSFERCVEEVGTHWASEPAVRRVANGVPRWLDRTAALGNAVVPQVVQYLARQVAEGHARLTDDPTVDLAAIRQRMLYTPV